MREIDQRTKDRTAVLRLLERSGQNVAEFCRERGLPCVGGGGAMAARGARRVPQVAQVCAGWRLKPLPKGAHRRRLRQRGGCRRRGG
jgi:hypothetical protein